MPDDFKTKILKERFKQEKKANLYIKYLISLIAVLLLGLFFLAFKDYFLNYLYKNFSEKNSLKDEKKISTEPDSVENNENSFKNIESFKEIDISEECKNFNLEEQLCGFKNLYQIVLKQLNEKSKVMLSVESINQIYAKQIKLFYELKEKSLKSFSNNFFDKAYIEITEANKIFNLMNSTRVQEFKNNMIYANKAYLERDESLAKEFIYNAEKYIPDDKGMLKLKGKITNISKIVKFENDIKAASVLKNIELEIDLIEKTKKLDSLITKYDDRLKKLRLLKKNKEFNSLVEEVQKLLTDDKTNIARKKLDLAKRIFPNNNIIDVLEESINKKDKTNKIKALNEEIANLIRDDKWKLAKNKYKEILILDNTNIFAIEGLNFANEISELIKEINIFNKTPLLLTKTDNINKGNLLIESASIYINRSKTLPKIVNILEKNIKLANEPAIVNIRSDYKTDIKVKKVGIIGKVKKKTLNLKAGKYIFEGKRIGYKTILIEKEIALDEKNVFLEIICNEPI